MSGPNTRRLADRFLADTTVERVASSFDPAAWWNGYLGAEHGDLFGGGASVSDAREWTDQGRRAVVLAATVEHAAGNLEQEQVDSIHQWVGFKRKTAGRVLTAGEVIFRKDRGSDKNEWAWGAVPPSKREINTDFKFKIRELKPLSVTLRSTLAALGHATSAHNTFVKIKSAKVSPDGNLGGRGYVAKIADMRRQYMNVVEALSALSDTLHDEITAPHWHLDEGGTRERMEVQEIMGDAEEIKKDPEAWAEEEEAEMDADHDAEPKKARKTASTSQRDLLADYFGEQE